MPYPVPDAFQSAHPFHLDPPPLPLSTAPDLNVPRLRTTPLKQQSSSQTSCRPSTSSLPRSHKRVKQNRAEAKAKRETSVPSLSQQLSSFSLRPTPSPELPTEGSFPPHLTSPFKMTSHPTSASLTTPYTSTFRHHLSPEHVLPKSRSAGPKFISQPQRQNSSPTPTEKEWDEGRLIDRPQSGWVEGRDWTPPMQIRGEHMEGRLLGSLQHSLGRRDTECSASSMEFSGSGTSSNSLLSLGRSSLEHHPRPSIVTKWDEETAEMECEEGAPARDDDENVSPTSKFSMAQTFSPFSEDAGLPSPTDMSSLADSQATIQSFSVESPFTLNTSQSSSHSRSGSRSGFLPRLLMNKRKSSVTLREDGARNGPRAPNVTEDEDMMTDVEEQSPQRSRSRSFWEKAKAGASRSPFDGGLMSGSFGLGIELGPRRASKTVTVGEENGLSISLASDSSNDSDFSPSKSVSSRPSTNILARPPSIATLPPLPSFNRRTSAPDAVTRPALPRRTSAVGAMLPRLPRTSSPSIPTVNALRDANRPPLRRGSTEPQKKQRPSLLSADTALNTPTSMPFADIRPSPSVFASAGLVKKKSRFSGVEIPVFGSEPAADHKRKKSLSQFGNSMMNPPSPVSPIRPMGRPFVPPLDSGVGKIISSNAAAALQAAQRTRGLRKKRSSMFKSGSSISSLDMIRGNSRSSLQGVSLSPVTPTKPDSMRYGITTPSPVRAAVVYPFASANAVDMDLFSTPPSNRYARPGALDAPIAERYRSMLAGSPIAEGRVVQLPMVRTSNPMLAANFKSAAPITTPARGQATESLASCAGKFGSDGITRLETDFTLVDNLGSGAFSQVWKAREKKTGKVYAVKAGKPYTGIKNRLRQLEEIAILRQLSLDPHPNVIHYVDSWESHSRLYILTSLVECGDLSSFLSLLSDHGGIREARVWKVLDELSQGIEHIHKHCFLHLDIKPSNILIKSDGGLVIADLGMAVVCGAGPDGRMLGGMSPALPERDQQGGFVWESAETPMDDGKAPAMVPSPIMDREVEGDREYLCPEALCEADMIGKGADVFSLGLLLLEAALNVVLPSNGDAWVQLRNDDFSDLKGIYVPRSVTSSPPHNPPADDPNMPVLSGDILMVIKGMMKSNPDRRWGLEDVWSYPVVQKVRGMERGKALVEESEEWLKKILGEAL
ncbi:hypothetical protein L202_01667 [Cryptococcus amylolentus CBS 6039]|uniref:Protein kinase domain-containing protein n=2 Tax=Cryptococcus amylolentus TaxID=104669 RepID=A0A1E3I5B8_9TREE|nr:hypothetical protein L202_01667 [Cryptococcus amylolentus CBS 6039]ODN83545.1 hypothetical protein L202_01667 [Cryptococcus amylolentus CBS 6039]ODO11045.1 hypothetical protein I350_01647 [Cryptococcus amylolentus CBS 6273]